MLAWRRALHTSSPLPLLSTTRTTVLLHTGPSRAPAHPPTAEPPHSAEPVDAAAVKEAPVAEAPPLTAVPVEEDDVLDSHKEMDNGMDHEAVKAAAKDLQQQVVPQSEA